MLFRKHSFWKTTLFGGLIVILPVALLIIIFGWLWKKTIALIAPLTVLLTKASQLQGIYANLISLMLIIIVCFLIGLVVRTRAGAFFHRQIEERFLRIAPGYNLLREIINQLFGKREHPFMRVALVEPFGKGTWMTGLITARYQDKMYTVFLPSGLNPTTGLIVHLPAEKVRLLTVSVEEAMRTLIACGAGSDKFWQKFYEEQEDESRL